MENQVLGSNKETLVVQRSKKTPLCSLCSSGLPQNSPTLQWICCQLTWAILLTLYPERSMPSVSSRELQNASESSSSVHLFSFTEHVSLLWNIYERRNQKNVGDQRLLRLQFWLLILRVYFNIKTWKEWREESFFQLILSLQKDNLSGEPPAGQPFKCK